MIIDGSCRFLRVAPIAMEIQYLRSRLNMQGADGGQATGRPGSPGQVCSPPTLGSAIMRMGQPKGETEAGEIIPGPYGAEVVARRFRRFRRFLMKSRDRTALPESSRWQPTGESTDESYCESSQFPPR